MFQSYGLYGHIRANRIRSVILLAGFVLLLQALLYSLLLLLHAGLGYGSATLDALLLRAAASYKEYWPLAMLLAAAWFAIAYVANTAMVNMATGARGLSRVQSPDLYNMLENLCISRGMAMPKLQIIENPALNAFASGLNERQYSVTVTRGLIDTLAPDEMEAVLAHELTHIRNRDTQMLVIAIIFAGVFAFFGDIFIRRWDFPYGFGPRDRRSSESSRSQESSDNNSDSKDGGKGGGGAVIAIVIAITVILITYGISTLIRFALSRSREYLADAGAAELTKNPDAMIRALQKISRNAHMDVPSRMEAFFIENPLEDRITGWFATHPTMADRIDALVRYAGGRGDVPETTAAA